MQGFKRVPVKREIRTLKSGHTYEYKLDYVAYYQDGKIDSISKHEKKYFDTFNGVKGGLYMKPVPKFLKNAFAKAKSFIEAQA